MENQLAPFKFDATILIRFDNTDRDEWDKSIYITALEEAGTMKIYSQWLIGKFAYEYQKKFQYGSMKELEKASRLSYDSLNNYKNTYAAFVQADEKFKLSDHIPANGYLPFTVVRLASKQDDPVKALNVLHDKNAYTIEQATAVLAEWKNDKDSREAAIEGEIVNEETGEVGKPVEIVQNDRPPRPHFDVKYSDESKRWQMIMTREACEHFDWSQMPFLKEVLEENEILARGKE